MLQQILAMQRGGGGGGGPVADNPLPDTSEKVQISSLSLLKMLKHGMKKFITAWIASSSPSVI